MDAEVQRRQHVAEPRRQVLLLLQVAAEREHRDVGREGEGGAEAVDVLEVARGRAGERRLDDARQRHRRHERAHGIRDREADVAEQRVVEIAHAALAVRVLRGVHLLQHERMAAHRALAEDDQAPRQDVRALDRDADRHHLVAAAEVILRPEHDALAALHVHRVVRDRARELRRVVLQDARRHRRPFAAVDRAGRHRARGVDDVGARGHARDHGLDALEAPDRQVELPADARVGAGRVHGALAAAGRDGRQRDAAADRELLDQHAPALARHRRPADDRVERHEHVLAADRPVLERPVQREVPPADRDAGRVARHQRDRDAVVVLVAAEQPVGIEQPEREADQRRDRRERDVALREVEADAGDLAALVHPLADDAGVRDRARVRSRARAGQAEAGDLVAAREARQIVVALFLRAVVHQQFGRPERVRHDHGRGDGSGAARDLHDDGGVRVRRELEAAVLLGDDHRPEAFLLDEVEDFGRQVGAAVRDVPVVDHPAELFAGPVDERLFLRRERRRLGRQQLVPVGSAGEQLAVPPDGAGLERLALGVRHRRQHPLVELEEAVRDPVAAQRPDVEQDVRQEEPPQRDLPPQRSRAEDAVVDEQQAEDERRLREARALVGERHHEAHEQHQPEDRQDHFLRSYTAFSMECGIRACTLAGSSCSAKSRFVYAAAQREGITMSKLIDRVQKILLAPKAEWPVIAAEPDTHGRHLQGLHRLPRGDRPDRDRSSGRR